MSEPEGIKFSKTGPDPKPPEPEKKHRGRPKGSTNKSAGRRPAMTGVKEGLMAYVGMAGTSLTMFPQTRKDGLVILTKGEPLVDSLMELAKTNREVANALKAMCIGGAWTGVIVASSMIALPIAANHHLLPGNLGMIFAVDEQGNTNADNLMSAMATQAMQTEDEPEAEVVSIVQDEGPSVVSS
jgi:hypothetical protein